jgi:hypothetical protein
LACLASVLPYILNRISIFVGKLPVYQESQLLINIIITISVPGNLIAQISEELCLLILCHDFREAVWEWLCHLADGILFVLTLGMHKNKKKPNTIISDPVIKRNNDLFIRRTNEVAT